MSEETKNLNHTDEKKEEIALKGMSMKERKKALEEKKEKQKKRKPAEWNLFCVCWK